MAKCRCSKRTRMTSRTVREMTSCRNGCVDMCANPVCGEPKVLSVMAPLLYDEIGINLCTDFELGVDIAAQYPNVTCASAKVINAEYSYGEGNVVIDSLVGRPNCLRITLSNITVEFAIDLYDANGRLVATIYPSAVYLPSDTQAPTYDEETNPSSAELDIYAPYGYSYSEQEGNMTPAINFVGFLDENNTMKQGLNLYGIAKLIDFDLNDNAATVGLTLVLSSMYYAGYKVASEGRIDIPKGSIVTPEDTECMKFVSGELLDISIKPLDLGAPAYEEQYKQNCETPGCGSIACDVTEPVPCTNE